jgi:endonuclease/exonuclease/phosphatase family metal-dependent hydrolase
MSEREVESSFGPLIQTRLRVASWNLWGRFGPWEERQQPILRTLERIDADVVGLQEVWAEPERNQAEVLATALGFHCAYASRLNLPDLHLGIAILSRWPIVRVEEQPLPALDEPDEMRLVLRADIDGPRGPLQVFTTHLNWRFDHSHVRQAQVRRIAEFITQSPGRTYPPILCGDLNAPPDADEIRMLTGRTTLAAPGLVFHDAWEVAGDGSPGFTWDNANPFVARDLEPDRRIDYVLAGWPKAGGAGHVVAARVAGTAMVDGVHPSDHAAIVADLRY